MHDHLCCVTLFAASVAGIASVIIYFKSKLSLARKSSLKEK